MKCSIIQVGVNLGRIEIAVAQNLLQGTRVNAVLQHQRSRGMTELVRGVSCRVQPGQTQFFFNHLLDTAHTEAAVFLTDKQRVLVFFGDLFVVADREIVVDRFTASVAEENDAFFVSFAQHAQMILIYIVNIKRNKL